MVFKKAKSYREILGISEDWGTAVVVQKMGICNFGYEFRFGSLIYTKSKRVF